MRPRYGAAKALYACVFDLDPGFDRLSPSGVVGPWLAVRRDR
jgi:hypothetical protein